MHPDWKQFPDTLLTFPNTGRSIDLTRPVGPPEREVLDALGLLQPFAVVTACNPRGTLLGPVDNRRREAILGAIVRKRFPAAVRVDGTSRDGAHIEPGWAIVTPLPDATSLAAQFFQLGLFWFDGRSFFIVPVLAPYPRLQLPVEAAPQ